jgi:acyl-CoA thioester hydrolase
MNSEPKFKFFTPVKVRYQDTDQQGHVYFGVYYTYFDEGVEGYLEAIGYSYRQMLADKIDFIFVESHCTYKSSVKWPEVLKVHTRIGHIGRRSLRYEFEIWADADGRLVATGYIAVVTVDRDTFKPQPVPDALRQAVANYEGELPHPQL